jgi:hypothetical protein
MWRTRKCAEGRSPLRRCRVASRVGWRRREAMRAGRDGSWGFEGAGTRGGLLSRRVDMEARVEGGLLGWVVWAVVGGEELFVAVARVVKDMIDILRLERRRRCTDVRGINGGWLVE